MSAPEIEIITDPTEIRKRAAEILKVNAWVKFQFKGRLTDDEDSDVCYCALGALREAAGYYRATDAQRGPISDYRVIAETEEMRKTAIRVAEAAGQAAMTAAGLGSRDIVDWNDTIAQTREDVVSVLLAGL